MKNYYSILEVEPTADAEQIRSQHRFLLHAWHPDKFPNKELKVKAEEKLREINEAYSVLNDPLKRGSYDKSLRNETQSPKSAHPQYRPEPTPKTTPQPTHPNHVSEDRVSNGRCQSCGLVAEIKHVEFFENVGMVFTRNHREVIGNLCKDCIDFYFFNMTGKTMLLGWWGVISMIVTPIFLINNLIRFIPTSNMVRSPQKIVPNPYPGWVLTTISGFLFAGYMLLAFFCSSLSLSASTASTTNTSPSRVSVPTSTSYVFKIPTKNSSDCVLWSSVSLEMVGQYKCVYGEVYKTKIVGNSTYQILFTNNQKSFFLAGGGVYSEVSSGMCVLAKGKILSSSEGVPYINIDDALYNCR